MARIIVRQVVGFPLILLTALSLPLTADGADLVFASWRVSYNEDGIDAIRFNDTTLLTRGSFTVFKPGYKGHFFTMAKSRVACEERDDSTILTWVKEKSKTATVTARLKLDANSLEWEAKMRITIDGPIEMGILVPPESVASPSGAIHCTINRKENEIYGEQFPTRTLTDAVVFQTPELECRFETETSKGVWLFQDRRSTQKHLRLIACLRGDGKQTLDAALRLRLQVTQFSDENLAQRRRRFSQSMRTLVPLPVKNGDFEAAPPLSGWRHPPNATLAEWGTDKGRRCARLKVKSPDEEGVYLTQQIPVTPGRHYRAVARVRAEDVQEARLIGMKSVGAVLIVEWADEDGKWLAPGRYAKGRFGNSGWHLQRIETVIAPPGARHAVIFLGLRGLGTAWFDDVQFYEVRRSAVLVSPFDGARVADNRPRFAWKRDTSAQHYRFQLSADRKFPAGGLQNDGTTEEPSFRLKRKLAPGRWFWRVGIDDESFSDAWAFNQTAPLEADTTGPELSFSPHSFTQPGESLIVEARDESSIDASSLRLSINGKRVPARAALDGLKLVVTPVRGWARGAHEASVTVSDRKGNVSEAAGWIVHGPRAGRTFTWTRDRGVFDGNKHEFPLGIYQVREHDLERVRKAGFDLVHNYQWEGSQDDEAARRYLDAVHRAGLRAFIGFDRGNSSGNGLVQGNFGHVARRIAALRDHPGLFAWYLFDEPDLDHQYIPPGVLQRFYHFIKALDPDHPVIVTLAKKNSVGRYGKCYDVYWSMVYRKTSQLADRLAQHRSEVAGEPLMAIVHCYDQVQSRKTDGTFDDSKFWPDAKALRANALMSVVRGTSGLVWWWFGDHKKKWLATPDVPPMWTAHKRLLSELRGISPMLLAAGKEEPVTVVSAPPEANVQARLRTVDDSLILIVVNPSEKEAVVRITSPVLRGFKRLRLRSGKRIVEIKGGELSDSLAPLAAHIYIKD